MLELLFHWLKKKLYYDIHKEIHRHPYLMKVGKSSLLMPSARIDCRVDNGIQRVSIGEDCLLGCTFIFESDQGSVAIGNRTFINGGTQLISRSKIVIGDDVTIAWGVWLYDHDSHSLDWRLRAEDIRSQIEDVRAGKDFITNKDWSSVRAAPIHICDKAWIGMNVIILKGVTVGEGAVVGAGSVVTHDVSPWTVVAGNPAREVKKLPH